MDEKKEFELFGLCAQKYSIGGTVGLMNFIEEYSGDAEEKKYLGRVQYLVLMRNHFAKFRLFNLHGYGSLDNLLNEIENFANPRIIVKPDSNHECYFEDITSLRIKLEEYRFKIYHQEL